MTCAQSASVYMGLYGNWISLFKAEECPLESEDTRDACMALNKEGKEKEKKQKPAA